MLAEVESDGFVLGGHPDRDEQIRELEERDGNTERIDTHDDQGREVVQEGGGLARQKTDIARQNSRQEHADDPADAVTREDIQSVVESRPGLRMDGGIAQETGD